MTIAIVGNGNWDVAFLISWDRQSLTCRFGAVTLGLERSFFFFLAWLTNKEPLAVPSNVAVGVCVVAGPVCARFTDFPLNPPAAAAFRGIAVASEAVARKTPAAISRFGSTGSTNDSGFEKGAWRVSA